MLYCGISKDAWVETALKYLPEEVFNEIKDKIAITDLNSDACRLAQKISEKDEIIVLSPWIFSYIPPAASEADKEWRYFIFVVLHEIAHAALKHLPPDELKHNDSESQEEEADSYALKWFNSYVLKNSDKGLTQLNVDEVRDTQAEYHRKLETILKYG